MKLRVQLVNGSIVECIAGENDPEELEQIKCSVAELLREPAMEGGFLTFFTPEGSAFIPREQIAMVRIIESEDEAW